MSILTGNRAEPLLTLGGKGLVLMSSRRRTMTLRPGHTVNSPECCHVDGTSIEVEMPDDETRAAQEVPLSS